MSMLLIQRTVAALLGLMIAATPAPPAAAQTPGPRPYAVGMTVGAAPPAMAGRKGPEEAIELGAHVALWAMLPAPGLPLRLLVEGQMTTFETSRMSQVLFETPRLRRSDLDIWAISTSLVVGLPDQRVRPFMVGGVGYYHIGPETVPNPFGGYSGVEIRPSDSGFGANAGGGIAFVLPVPTWTVLDGSLTVRYHSVFTVRESAAFLPIALSIRLY